VRQNLQHVLTQQLSISSIPLISLGCTGFRLDGVASSGKLIKLAMLVTRKPLAVIVLPGYNVRDNEALPLAKVCSKIDEQLFLISQYRGQSYAHFCEFGWRWEM
jgi:hypothetical protein